VPGSLAIVGTGICLGVQLTPEARAAIQNADAVLYLAAEPASRSWLESLRPDARSLHHHYRVGRPRRHSYEAMVDEILGLVRGGAAVCVAFYGHPGVFVTPSHAAIARAHEEGFEARMLPAVSAEDCLFADLGVDPGRRGCLSFEATDFLVNARPLDTSAVLVLWQVSVIGAKQHRTTPSRAGLRVLQDRLELDYPRDHEVVLYEASPYPIAGPLIVTLPLTELGEAEPTPLATLYVPPSTEPVPEAAVLERLGLSDDG
jgi:uncharacterized protein YabN with tetrapyrrole methylase and pyrophosphatase domain